MLDRALALVEEGSPEYGKLNASLGMSLQFTNDNERAEEAFGRARAVAERLGLKTLQLSTLLSQASFDLQHWRLRDMFRYAEQAVALARELDDPQAGARAHLLAARNGDIALRDAAREHALAHRAAAERTRNLVEILGAAESECLVAGGAGDWDVLREASARALEIEPRALLTLTTLADMEVQLGNLDQSAGYLTRMADVGENPRTIAEAGAIPLFAISAAMYCYVTGTSDYLPRIEQAGRMTLSNATTPPTWVGIALTSLGIQASLAGDRQAAREHLEGLERFAGWWVWGLTIDHVRGLLFDTLDQTEEAIAAIETTLAYPQTGYGLRACWSWAAYDCARIRLKARCARRPRSGARADR